MRHDKATMNYQRKMLALFGVLLPILAPLMGFVAYQINGPEFWWSISATFYATSNWLMIGTLAIFSFFLFTYKGYDLGDEITCKVSAGSALGILLFPCACLAAGPTTGILNFPTPVSHVLHCIIAAILFGSFAYMIGWRFTKTDTSTTKTKGKEKRNRVYKICSYVIIGAMCVQVITSIFDLGWFTIINEAIMLWAFSFAWAIKADMFKKYFGD